MNHIGKIFESGCFQPKNTRFAWDQPTTTTTPKGPTTTEDIVIYEKGQDKVELEVPDELFGSGFTLLTNLSQTAGDLITVSSVIPFYLSHFDISLVEPAFLIATLLFLFEFQLK